MANNANAIPHPGWIKVFVRLMKLRVIVLLQITAICAILVHDLLARHDLIDIDRSWGDTLSASLITVVGGTLSAGGSNAINMWFDADIDQHMRRTQNRPVPLGHISARGALIFGLIIAISGSALFLFFSWKAAFWSLFSVLFYVIIYTIWLKRRTPQNIVIGGIAGSTPPLIGWAVAAADYTNSMNPFDLGSAIPWMLFALIFLWTPPHFWALALYRSGEYAKADVPMMNEVKGAEHTIFQSKIYCVLLLMLGSVPCFWPESGLPLLWAFIAGGLTIWYAASVWAIDPQEPFDENGRMPKAAKSFFRSLYYLGWMFLLLVLVCIIPPESLGYFGPLSQN
ncbi:MAG: heme o synthase [Candidatus Thermoplasmatota archaeon]|nr:heme o synthase [Candidatus Thermoplasmatota archaeon]MEC8242335.1 heme o synthase [Candidatus Thermoplasmatota archaeon]MEC8249907.1 heme o synthase [Candidatus Thermoplasmatota archaeon]MEC8258284.1 heme o synthase [Candidatus Thermoplasmatota archaeon]MEC8313238.1 heme o synthase [Candidatus Thermoplasmatota archaeon]